MRAGKRSPKSRAAAAEAVPEYPVELWTEPDGTHRGRFPDLPRSEFTAPSNEAVLATARKEFAAWKAWAEGLGIALPPPNSREKYSGIVRIRVGRSVHRHLLDKCKEHKVALSNLVSSMLHAGLDWLEGDLKNPALGDRPPCEPVPNVAIVKKRQIDYSKTSATGAWTQNIPIELHQRLGLMAKAEGNISINLMCNFLITRVLFDFTPVVEQTRMVQLAVA